MNDNNTPTPTPKVKSVCLADDPDIPNVHIHIDRKSKTIDIWGGDSGFTGDFLGSGDVYYIDFSRVWENWMSHMYDKPWMNDDSLYALETALNTIRKEQP